MLALLLIASLSFATEIPTTVVCYDGKEKLIDLPVKSAQVVNKGKIEVVDLSGEKLTIVNLNCSVKQ